MVLRTVRVTAKIAATGGADTGRYTRQTVTGRLGIPRRCPHSVTVVFGEE